MIPTVIAITAVCDVVTPLQHYETLRAQGWSKKDAAADAKTFARGIHFDALEAAHISDGRAVLLRDQLGGVTVLSKASAEAQWTYLTASLITQQVLNLVLPDDAEETGDEHPWDTFALTLRDAGVQVSAEELRAVPYLVVLAPRLQQRLQSVPAR